MGIAAQQPATPADQNKSDPAKKAETTDSRGEEIYVAPPAGTQSKAGGVFVRPKLIKLADPDCLMSLRVGNKLPTDVLLAGVVALNGDFIDIRVVRSTYREASDCAVATALKYRFKPAMLDGKPLATRLQISVGMGH